MSKVNKFKINQGPLGMEVRIIRHKDGSATMVHSHPSHYGKPIVTFRRTYHGKQAVQVSDFIAGSYFQKYLDFHSSNNG